MNKQDNSIMQMLFYLKYSNLSLIFVVYRCTGEDGLRYYSSCFLVLSLWYIKAYDVEYFCWKPNCKSWIAISRKLYRQIYISYSSIFSILYSKDIGLYLKHCSWYSTGMTIVVFNVNWNTPCMGQIKVQ